MLPALLLLLQVADDPPLVYSGRLRQLDVAIPRLEASARVDGVLDEPVWGQAARLTGFSQYRPVDGRSADDSTEVRVWYAADAIWFGVRAYEGHGAVVRATLADRDQIDADDLIRILLDTYNDRRRALMFAVNPLGAQQDGVWSDGADQSAGGPGAGFRFDAVVDINPDYVFQSKGRVSPQGYEVEVRIPFKSIRYQSADPQDWGLQVVRVVQHSGYEDTWTPAVRANASFLVQSGTLRGLRELRRGLVLDVSPEFTTQVNGQPETAEYDYVGEPEVGANFRWGITTNLSLSATVNPDFSQVEADVGQVTVNERFALFFPEKRPFFLEGIEQYDTPSRLIYMRRIADPVVGVKLTGKIGGTNVAWLGAVDEQSQSASGATPVVNLVRLRRDVGASSALGLVYTDRIDRSDYNRVLGADARIVWRKIWFSDAQLAGSWTRDALGAQAGELWRITLFDRTGRSYGNHAELSGVSPDFRASGGFVNRVDIVQSRIFNRFSWYGRPGALFEQVTTILGVEPTWRYEEFFNLASTLEGQITSFWLLTLRGGWSVNPTVRNAHQRFDPPVYAGYRADSAGTPVPFVVPHGLFNLWSTNLEVVAPNRALTFSGAAGYGASVIFVEATEGRQADLAVTAIWKPTA